jgi:GWxTD domain-containing protein
MIAFIALLFLSNAIEFDVEPVVYRSKVTITDTVTQTAHEEKIFYLEFNCGIPYNELEYETIDDTIITKAVISFKLFNPSTGDSLSDTLRRRFRIPSFAFAAQQQLTFLIQFGVHVFPGVYEYVIDVSSGTKSGHLEHELSITDEHHMMSDLLLASSITADTLRKDLKKGDLQVVPHPSHVFNDRYTQLYLYYEVYDLAPLSGYLKTIYTIEDSTGVLIAKIPRRVQKMYSSQAINFGIDITDINSGHYTLKVDVEDEDTDVVRHRATHFDIIRPEQQQIGFEGMPHYDDIEYFITEKQYDEFKSYSSQGKKRFLEKFWKEHDYFEIADRFDYADDHFKQGNKPGSRTDRGRIYVKYGRWDEIEKSTIEVELSKPYERWYYYNGIEFIFVDIRGTNEYTLVWTDARDEHSQPTLYKYLPETIQEEIE